MLTNDVVSFKQTGPWSFYGDKISFERITLFKQNHFEKHITVQGMELVQSAPFTVYIGSR